ncbi:MAG TPA: hypothetical protein VF681_04860 [Abditibacteriaceae bacterium]
MKNKYGLLAFALGSALFGLAGCGDAPSSSGAISTRNSQPSPGEDAVADIRAGDERAPAGFQSSAHSRYVIGTKLYNIEGGYYGVVADAMEMREVDGQVQNAILINGKDGVFQESSGGTEQWVALTFLTRSTFVLKAGAQVVAAPTPPPAPTEVPITHPSRFREAESLNRSPEEIKRLQDNGILEKERTPEEERRIRNELDSGRLHSPTTSSGQ